MTQSIFEISNGIYRIGNSIYFLVIKEYDEELLIASDFKNWRAENIEKYNFGFRFYNRTASEVTKILQREEKDKNIIVVYNPGVNCKSRCEFVKDVLKEN